MSKSMRRALLPSVALAVALASGIFFAAPAFAAEQPEAPETVAAGVDVMAVDLDVPAGDAAGLGESGDALPSEASPQDLPPLVSGEEVPPPSVEGEGEGEPDGSAGSAQPDPTVGGKLIYEGSACRYLLEDGTYLRDSWLAHEGNRYYFGSDGLAYRWSQNIDGKLYYFNGKGVMHTGLLTWSADGRTSCFGSDGAALTGWQTVGGKRYFFGEDYRALRWSQNIDGKLYYFNGKGVMHTGWLTWSADGRHSYFDEQGVMLYGKQVIDGVTYDFGEDGKTDTAPDKAKMSAKAQAYSSSTDYLILVNSKTNYVGIFKGSEGAWKLDRYLRCTSGAPNSPTKKGSFTVGNRGLHFGEEKGYTCWYWTQFSGDYLFHSILYNPGSKTSIQDGRLGINASHGCVRLKLEDAKWIYDNIPRGTKVISY